MESNGKTGGGRDQGAPCRCKRKVSKAAAFDQRAEDTGTCLLYTSLQWLVDARLVHKIYRSSAPGLPIAAYDDLSAFKIYLVDVGLLRRLAQLAPTAFGEGNRLFTDVYKRQSLHNVIQKSCTLLSL